MTITIAVISILIISGFIWLANRILLFSVCPICAGGFLTWMGLVSAHFAGYQINLLVPAILMGGSVVGIAYQLEKKFHSVSAGALMFWKVIFMPVGFVAVYALLSQEWLILLFAIAVLVLTSFPLMSSARTEGPLAETVSGIEKKMEHCC